MQGNKKVIIPAIFFVFICSYFIYSYWIYTTTNQLQAKNQPSQAALNGFHVWQENNCQSCHQFYGLGGYLGPDLTNTISDSTKGATYAEIIIRHGSVSMPNLHLNDEQVKDLMAFMKWVDKSGRNMVSSDEVHWSGTYIFNRENTQ